MFFRLLSSILLILLVLSGCGKQSGNIQVSDKSPVQWPPPPEPPRIRFLYAFKSASDLDIGGGFLSWFIGKSEQYLLRRPVAVTVNSSGIIYVADLAGAIFRFDQKSGKVRRQNSAGDEFLVSPVAMTLKDDSLYVVDSVIRSVFIYDGNLNPARSFATNLERPSGIAWDSTSGYLYIADAGGFGITVFTPDGTMVDRFGKAGENLNEFNTPTHLWLADDGFYVTDAFNFKVKKVSSDGRVLATYGKLGTSTGSLARPKGIATDRKGHLYVVDALFGNVQIFDDQGRLLLFFGSTGAMGPGSFCLPNGIFIDDRDRIYVADTYHGSIQVFQYIDIL